MEYLVNFLLRPEYVSLILIFFILHYYLDAVFFREALKTSNKRFKENGICDKFFKRNGWYDIVTSAWRFLACVLSIVALIFITYNNQPGLLVLIFYYLLFIFLFAFCYELLDWHFDEMISNIDRNIWRAEWQYILMSIQTQTTLGYTEAKPKHPVTEAISVVQVLLGLFFTIIFVAQAVSKMAAKCP